MGWRDAFKGGDTSRINVAAYNGGGASKSFGDAFGNIGKILIDSQAADEKSKLIGLQTTNEQNKLDEHTAAQKQTKLDDAFKLDMRTLDPSATDEAKQNAITALKQNYTPSNDAVVSGENTLKAQTQELQASNDKNYLKDAFTLDPTASKESRDNATYALGEFYKPDTTVQDKMVEHFTALDKSAQGKFNDEGVGVSVSGGYGDYASFVKDNPEVIKHIDGATEKSIKLYFDDIAKAKTDKQREDARLELERRRVAVSEGTLNQSKYEFAHPEMKAKSGDGGEKDSKIVDAINKIITTKFGKVNANGIAVLENADKPKAQWIGTRALSYASGGKDASTSYVQAEADWNKMNKTKNTTVDSDPLKLRPH